MTTPEKKVKEQIKHILEEAGCYYFMPPANGYGQSGRFDIVCSYFGHFIGIEVKADATKKPTALQTRNAKLAYSAGSSVLLIHEGNTDVLQQTLEGIKQHGDGYNRVRVWPEEKRA